jgi:hypothetical protein
MSDQSAPSPSIDGQAPDACAVPPRRTAIDGVIEQNGQEYLVTINGEVFLALSFAGAEAIARRAIASRRGVR